MERVTPGWRQLCMGGARNHAEAPLHECGHVPGGLGPGEAQGDVRAEIEQHDANLEQPHACIVHQVELMDRNLEATIVNTIGEVVGEHETEEPPNQ